MSENYCEYFTHWVLDAERTDGWYTAGTCGAVARFKKYGKYYCAKHYDNLIAAEKRSFDAARETFYG